MALQRYPLFDFSAGVNLNVSRLLMADNECFKIENGELENIGSVKKVRGYVQRGDDVSTGYDILGLCSAFKSDGTQKQIAVANGAATSDAYTFNPVNSTWTPHGLGLSLGSKAEFEYFLDGFFMVNYSEATRYNNLTAWDLVTNVTNAPKAKYIKQYLSRIYLGYVNYGGTAYPSRIVYSDLPAGGPPLTISWTNATNYFDVDNDDGDVIKGLAENANRLLIFKENSLQRYDTNSRYKVPGCPGTVSNRSIVNIQGWTVYFHSTGIWGYNGTTSTLLSRKISDLIEGIPTINFINSCAFGSGDHYYLYVGDVYNYRAGLNIPKCIIDMDLAKSAFAWRSINKEPTVFSEYRDDRSRITYDDATVTYDDANVMYNGLISAEPRIYFGASDGAVYQTDTGNDYDGDSIAYIVETKDFYFNLPSNYKLLQKVQVYMKYSLGAAIQYRMDDGDWKTLGKLSKSQTELIFPAASRCKRVRFRIMEMSTGGQFSFEGLDVFYTVEGLIA